MATETYGLAGGLVSEEQASDGAAHYERLVRGEPGAGAQDHQPSGGRLMAYDRARLARHEAGHTAGLILTGRVPARVSAVWPFEGAQGVTVLDFSNDGINHDSAPDFAVMLLLGPLAEETRLATGMAARAGRRHQGRLLARLPGRLPGPR